jgi:hypothetical protein
LASLNVNKFDTVTSELFYLIYWGWVRLSPLGTSASTWSIVPAPDDRDNECRAIGGMGMGKGNRSTRKETCPSATSSTTNPTWPDLIVVLYVLINNVLPSNDQFSFWNNVIKDSGAWEIMCNVSAPVFAMNFPRNSNGLFRWRMNCAPIFLTLARFSHVGLHKMTYSFPGTQ